MIIQISKRELHLAAFIKHQGAVLLDYKSGQFIFESQLTEVELRVQHSNSESLKVDRELFTLKAFFIRE
jgi:hypothetical protein|tara:strand:+ start:2719 stop:2925 length:207 start_codon:yes stop_codon:yes gene_type:complete